MMPAGLADEPGSFSRGPAHAMELERKYETPYVIGAPVRSCHVISLAAGAVTGKKPDLCLAGNPQLENPAVGEPVVKLADVAADGKP